MIPSVIVVVNPVSGWRRGRGDASDRAAQARRALDALGVAGEVRATERRGHARALAAEAADHGVPLVVAWGGDGTINEVGSALVSRDCSLGVVAAGSGNGLARELGVPLEATAALAAAIRGRDRLIDAGELGGRLFFNIAGIGLDAHVARLFDRTSGRRGLWPYLKFTAGGLMDYEPVACTIEVGGHGRRTTALLIVFANGRQYGFGARVAPGAALDDGLLDLVVAERRPALANLWHARRLFNGSVERVPGVRIERVAEASVVADRPLGFHVDGEVFEGTERLEARVHPRALRVRVPPPGLL
jgi:YegS/Rv2252/BmrU family lipid kinase